VLCVRFYNIVPVCCTKVILSYLFLNNSSSEEWICARLIKLWLRIYYESIPRKCSGEVLTSLATPPSPHLTKVGFTKTTGQRNFILNEKKKHQERILNFSPLRIMKMLRMSTFTLSFIITCNLLFLQWLPWTMLDDWLFNSFELSAWGGGGQERRKKALCTLPHHLTSRSRIASLIHHVTWNTHTHTHTHRAVLTKCRTHWNRILSLNALFYQNLTPKHVTQKSRNRPAFNFRN
jgi:hypothetical protein